MRVSSFVLVALVVSLSLFAGLNWSTIGQSAPVDYLFGNSELPLGLLLLAASGVFVLFHLATNWTRDASRAVEMWQAEKEVSEAREHAMDTDESRVDRMSKSVDERLSRVESQLGEVLDRLESISIVNTIKEETADVEERVGAAEEGIRDEIRKSTSR